jgi:thioredoxin 1
MSAAIARFRRDVRPGRAEVGQLVLVDFWAEWCGPCKMFAPVLDEVAKEYGGKITVAKLDIDANPSTPGKYGIRGIPTVILYKVASPMRRRSAR